MVKTTLAAVAGIGGIAALSLTLRRQMHQEHATRIEHSQKEIAAADARHDANERRLTELYVKSAEQLGSDKAPVRLAALYALERIAISNSAQRQVVVNLICAYLRMPFVLPAGGKENSSPLWRADPPQPEASDYAEQKIRVDEVLVRSTAQDILLKNLPIVGTEDSEDAWRELTINLDGATLINFSLANREVHICSFANAYFYGEAGFHSVRFRTAGFVGAQFTSSASFFYSEFTEGAYFSGAKFAGIAAFNDCNFRESSIFIGTRFEWSAQFNDARFGNFTNFQDSSFLYYVFFDEEPLSQDGKPPLIKLDDIERAPAEPNIVQRFPKRIERNRLDHILADGEQKQGAAGSSRSPKRRPKK